MKFATFVLSVATGDTATGARVPAERSLRQRALKGTAWWVAVTPFQKLIAMGANVILAALLSPTIFGVMALAEVVHRGVRMFSDIGIRPALVQNRREDPAFVNTAWTIQAFRGVIVWIVASLLAWPMAQFYGEPILMGLVPVVALTSILGGLESTSLATLNRRMDEKPRALLSLAETFLTRGGMIGVALVWPTAWALAAGSLIAGAFNTVASHTLLPGIRNRFTWDRDAAQSLIRFGKWIFLGSIIAFFAREIDKLLLGKLLAAQVDAIGLLGVYAIARRFARMSTELMGPLGGQMALPIMSEIARKDRVNFGRRIRRFRGLVHWPAVTLCLGIGVVAPAFFGLLYDERYAAAMWMAPLIVIGVWIGQLNKYAHHALLALGKPKPLTFGSAIKLVVSTIGSLVGFYLFDMPGFILGMMIGGVANHLFVLWKLHASGVHLFLQDAWMTLVFLSLIGGSCGSMWLGQQGLGGQFAWFWLWLVPALLWLAVFGYTLKVVVPEIRRRG